MYEVLEIPALPPRSIVLTPPLTDVEFERMCAQASLGFLERSKEGTITVNAPAGGMTSDANAEITRQLRNWWLFHRIGRTFDSNAGFFLPDGSMLSPDAAYATAAQLQGLTRADLVRFPRFAPAFIIELRSESDRLAEVQAKMETWIANGAELAWLIDPDAKQVHVYAQGNAPRVESGSTVAGSGPVDGFVLDLQEVWRCYE
jgi:Uma2 family endonuclease